MELSELVAYARDKYGIEEQRKWAGFPGFSVLSHPRTGKWVALLMKQWDTETGEEIQRCDLKCGIQTLTEHHEPYLGLPIRMKGPKWISAAFSDETDPQLLFSLFDRAVTSGDVQGFTMVLETPPQPAARVHHDTPLPLLSRSPAERDAPPERLRMMRHLYEYSSNSIEARAANFIRQGRFMADYEDEASWAGLGFVCYFPTYHDMTTRQLRGYFAWRTHVRRGDYQPIAISAAYIYLYELLNLIGADSPEDALEKLKGFETGYLDAGYGDTLMRTNLRRWMTELAVVHALPEDTAHRYADPALLERDRALAVLMEPDSQTDHSIFTALSFFEGKRLAQSPAVRKAPGRGERLFSRVWRAASCERGDLFTRCFGKQTVSIWHPFANAVYSWQDALTDRVYHLDACRSYRCRRGVWQMLSWEPLTFDRPLFHGLIRQADLMLRRYLKTGNYLREDPEDLWAVPYVHAAIRAEEKAAAESARPKVILDLSGLERIRREALITRDSLLTEEEREDAEAAEAPAMDPASAPDLRTDLPLDDVQLEILRALLVGKPVSGILRAHRLMPAMTADMINEALFDEIGDNTVDCDNDTLSLVEDYREDLIRLLGGDRS